MWVLAKNLAFLILVPGTVGYYVPVRMIAGTRLNDVHWSAASVPGLLLLGAGGALMLWCFWHFTWTGRGTAAPFDPPVRLVVRGPYRYLRNPMYVGMVLFNLGWAALLRSTGVAEYALALWLGFHLFVWLVEEPGLRLRFGTDYETYCRAVRRWLPGVPYRPAGA